MGATEEFTFYPGDRVEMTEDMPDDPQPILSGQQGTVTMISGFGEWTQIHVDWDCGRRLALLETDPFTKI